MDKPATDHYFTLSRTGEAEFKDRGSRFLAYAFPLTELADFKSTLQVLRKTHPKAVHHCFAYRMGLDGNIFRVSDDGEPSGTAGRPILGQIDSKGLTDTAIIVTRYFGGTLLGVPGLIHAYKTAASLVLQTIPPLRKEVELRFMLECDYQGLNEVIQIVKQCEGAIQEQELHLFPRLQVSIPVKRADVFLSRAETLRNVSVQKILL